MDEIQAEALIGINAAKRMIATKDYNGAKIKLLEVQKQVGEQNTTISAVLNVCRILSDAELTLMDGESDWYWVLQVGPGATVAQISSHYLRLTKLLDPIKNDFPGTSSALNLLHDAFSILSHPRKRLVYDSRRISSWGSSDVKIEDSIPVVRNPICIDNVSLFHGGSVSKKVGENVNIGDLKDSNDVVDETSGAIQVTPASPTLRLGDIAHSRGIKLPGSVEATNQNPDYDFHDFKVQRSFDIFEIGQVWAAYDAESVPRRYALIKSICRSPFGLGITWFRPVPSNEDERRGCDAGLPVVCGVFHCDGAEELLTQFSMFSHLLSRLSNIDKIEIYPQEHEVWAVYEDCESFKPEANRGCTLQLVEVLEGYHPSQKAVMVASLGKVEGFKNIFKRQAVDDSGSRFLLPARLFYKFSHNVPAYRFNGGEMDGVSHGMFELDPRAIMGASISAMANSAERCHPYISSECFPSPRPSVSSRNTSGNLEWSANDFSMDQVWAVYDCDNMPRRYVIIKKLISDAEVCATYLEPHPSCDDDFHWVKEKLPIACGSFKVGVTTLTIRMSRFSHLVNYESSGKFFFKIHPKKGEVWAIYKNWEDKWKHGKFEICQYQIVEIISDFCENSGQIMAVGLEEVPGYKTFFQRKLSDGFELTRAISRTQMLSFSHCIVAFSVPGIQAHGIPEHSLHLEPKSLPPPLQPVA
ncbi:hypothetical protein Dimus_016819 [Dionaea muscipula]